MDHDFAELLEASSLGTPAARLIRSMADPEAGSEVNRRMANSAARLNESDATGVGEPELCAMTMPDKNADVRAPVDSPGLHTPAIRYGVGVLTHGGVISADLKEQLRVAHPECSSSFEENLGLIWGQVDDINDALDSIRLIRFLAEAYNSVFMDDRPYFVVFVDARISSKQTNFFTNAHYQNSPHYELLRACQSERVRINESNDGPGRDLGESTLTPFAFFYRSSCHGMRGFLPPHPERNDAGELSKVERNVWLFWCDQAEDDPPLHDLILSGPAPERLPQAMRRLWRIAAMSNDDRFVKCLVQNIVTSSVTAERIELLAELLGQDIHDAHKLGKASFTSIQEAMKLLRTVDSAARGPESVLDQLEVITNRLEHLGYHKDPLGPSIGGVPALEPPELSRSETPYESSQLRGHARSFDRPGLRPTAGLADLGVGGLGGGSSNDLGELGGVAFPNGKVSALGRLSSSDTSQEKERQRVSRISEDEAWRELADPLREAHALFDLSCACFRTGRHGEALRYAQRSFELYRSLADEQGKADVLEHRGLTEWQRSRYRNALTSSRQALDIRRSLGDRRGEARVLDRIAIILEFVGRYREAVDLRSSALEIYTEIDDSSGLQMSLNNQGDLMLRLGRVPEARGFYENAAVAVSEMTRQHEAIWRNNMARIHQHTGRNAEALKGFRYALATYRQIGDRHSEIETLIEIGVTYHQMGKREEALIHYEQAYAAAHAISELFEQTKALRRIGDVLLDEGRLTEALDHLQRAIELADTIGEPYERARALEGVGRIYLHTRGRHQGRRLWKQALKFYDRAEMGSEVERLRALLVSLQEIEEPDRC